MNPLPTWQNRQMATPWSLYCTCHVAVFVLVQTALCQPGSALPPPEAAGGNQSAQRSSEKSVAGSNVYVDKRDFSNKAKSAGTSQTSGQENNSTPHGSPQHQPSLLPVGTARSDSAYRYLAEKGAEFFRNGRFAEAEKFYRAALTNAEHDGVHDKRLAMLVTNLATDLRQQQRYEEAEPLFERAVDIERKTAPKDEQLMVYTAKQYAALLRETARDASAEAIVESAHNNFEMVPIIKARPLHDEVDSDSDGPALDNDAREHERRIGVAPYLVPDPAPVPTPTFSALPAPALSVTAELKMLADIERSYQNETMQWSQMLPSNFSYMNSGPLYSSPGLSGVYLGGGLSGGLGGGLGGPSNFSHGHSHGGGGGHHR